jgi:hypothetical protein
MPHRSCSAPWMIALGVALGGCASAHQTASTQQPSTFCYIDGQQPISCYADGNPDRCSELCQIEGDVGGYCPETSFAEWNWCHDPGNCGRAVYSSVCINGACPYGVPHFRHYCVAGSEPTPPSGGSSELDPEVNAPQKN